MKRTKKLLPFLTLALLLTLAACARGPVASETPRESVWPSRPGATETPGETAEASAPGESIAPTLTADYLIGAWESGGDCAFEFFGDLTGYLSLEPHEIYRITAYRVAGGTLSIDCVDYYTAGDAEPEAKALAFQPEQTGADGLRLTGADGAVITLSRRRAPAEAELYGYWLHNSGLYGFEAVCLAEDGTGWYHGPFVTQEDKYIFGRVAITHWDLADDCRLQITYGNAARYDTGAGQVAAVANSSEVRGIPVNFMRADLLSLEPLRATEALYYDRVDNIDLSDDLTRAEVSYFGGAGHNGITSETIIIFETS